MRNDLTMLPWQKDQFFLVEIYWEAVGVVAALKAGLVPGAVRRPLRRTGLRSAVPQVAAEETQPVRGQGVRALD